MKLSIMSRGERSIMRVIAVVDNFFDLMFDLFLADRTVSIG